MTSFLNLPTNGRILGSIAMFLGAALQYELPECNAVNRRRVSTIKVKQHKSKFSDVIVYCELAEHGLVTQAFDESSESVSFESFFNKRLFADAIYYRKCYTQMMCLTPQYKDAILRGANHPELLSSDPESLCAYLKDTQNHLLTKYRVDNITDLGMFLRSVSDNTIDI